MFNDIRYIMAYISERGRFTNTEIVESDIFFIGGYDNNRYYLDHNNDCVYVVRHNRNEVIVYGFENSTYCKKYIEENGDIVSSKYCLFEKLDYGERFKDEKDRMYVKASLDDKVYNAAYAENGVMKFCHFDNNTQIIRIDKEG